MDYFQELASTDGHQLSLIVALAEDGLIGRDGQLPWHLPADLRRFRQTTMGHALVMGRKTYESLGRRLPGRASIVLTRRAAYNGAGALVAYDWDQALRLASGFPQAFVIGGAEIYELALPVVTRIFATFVQGQFTGDTFFPEIHWNNWQVVREEMHPADPANRCSSRFVEMVQM